MVGVNTADINGLVGEKQVKDLPLNGRSYDELLTLNPSVVNFTWEKTGGIGVSNSTVGNNFAVSGNRPQQNLFLLNGVEFTGAAENNMQPGGTSQQLLGVDAVQEFNLLADSYGAEYGKRPGGQVLIVTQSGTNQLHGSLYEYLRNNALDAANYFDPGSAPGFQRNQFGVALGGPVQRDKTFVFGNYEGFRQHLHQTGVDLVPDTNARSGYLPCQLASGLPCSSSGLAFVGVSPFINAWPAPTPGAPDFGGIAEAFNNPLQTIRDDFGTHAPGSYFFAEGLVQRDLHHRRQLGFHAHHAPTLTAPTSKACGSKWRALRRRIFSRPACSTTSASDFRAPVIFSRANQRPGTPAASLPGFLAGTSGGRDRGRRQRGFQSHGPIESGRKQQRKQSRRGAESVHL